MGVALGKQSPEIKAQRAINNEIEKGISKEKLRQLQTVKILLLGGPKSGKTTIFKQMRILHQNGFTKADLINYRYLIYSNVQTSVTQLLDGLEKLSIPLDSTIKEDVDAFQEFCAPTSSEFELALDLHPGIAQSIQKIWISDCIQTVFRNRFSIELLQSTERKLASLVRALDEISDGMGYGNGARFALCSHNPAVRNFLPGSYERSELYLNNIEKISDPHYLPDDQDILLCRKRTIGVQEITFTYRSITFNMVDVGGQKAERRKWIHCFDDVQLILFIISMSDFDTISEDSEQNSLLESIEIFDSICNNKFLRKASVVLFLNKRDVFEEKLAEGKSLDACFPNYKGQNSLDAASKFITEKFGEKMPGLKSFHAHLTTATNTENVSLVFGSAVEHIVKGNLGTLGIAA